MTLNKTILNFKYTFILVILFLASCSKKKKYFYKTGELYSIIEVNNKDINNGFIKTYYKSGKVKATGKYKNGIKSGEFISYYETGEVNSLEYYKNDIKIDTNKYFYKNGKIKSLSFVKEKMVYYKNYSENTELLSEGTKLKNIKNGWWFYYKNNRLKYKVDYVIKDTVDYVNQTYVIGSKGLISKDSSNYFKLNFPDTITINKPVVGSIKLQPYLSKENDFHMVYFNFLNSEGKIMSIDSTYGKNNKEAILWGKFREPGVKTLKGYILEKKLMQRVNKKDTSMVDMYNVEHKMFFEKKIYVIEGKKDKIAIGKATDKIIDASKRT
jgi:hypothetical protein